MNDIPIFDSLTHPTFNGDWILPKYSTGIASIEKLIEDMDKSNISHAIACGMKDIGEYEQNKYIEFIRDYGTRLYPIAFVDFKEIVNVNNYISKIKALGYIGVKVHSRISDISISNPIVADVISQCEKKGLIVFLCTYFYANNETSYANNVSSLIKLLRQTYPAKIVLAHAGCVNLMEYVEVARVFENVLLDLSFTIHKYFNSSVREDIKYVFESFDRRICIGSDHPEITIENLRMYFNYFCENIDKSKAENIAYKNLSGFLNI